MLLEYMRNNDDKIESLEIASKISNKKERQTRNILNKLIDKNLIERLGSNKTGF